MVNKNYNSHFFIWAKQECSFCQEAIELLVQNIYSHTVYTMDKREEELKEVKKRFNWETVPIIIEQCSNGETKFIGGCSDLKEHFNRK